MKKYILSPFWRASFFLSGMIMGVGMYGIPYVFSRAGFFLGLVELVILSGVVLLVHLMYGEIVLRTRAWHRLPGYARVYGGRFAEVLAICSYFVSFSGALAAYILLGGTFLSNLFSGSHEMWSYAALGVGAIILFSGTRLHSKVDAAIVMSLVVLIGLIFLFALPNLKYAYFETINIADWFLPYGIIMFALSGMAAIPEMAEILEHDPRRLRHAITAGSLIPAVLYALFAIAVVGVSGSATTEEAIAGFADVLGSKMLVAGSLIGSLSTFSSFIALGSVFKSMLHLDMKIGWRMSWLLTIAIPFMFIFTGFKNYLPVIGFLGGVAIAIDWLMTLFIYKQAVLNGNRPSEYALHIPPFILVALAIVFISGALYEIMYLTMG